MDLAYNFINQVVVDELFLNVFFLLIESFAVLQLQEHHCDNISEQVPKCGYLAILLQFKL